MSKTKNNRASTPYSVRQNYSVSQNFLTSAGTIRRLISLTTITPDDHIIEIGAGKGHITRALADSCRVVDAYEVDPKLFPNLKQNLSGRANVNLRFQDFLSAKLPNNAEYKVFSNIPFSITTDIVNKLTSGSNPPRDAWLFMEKGAAKRFMGKPRDGVSSLLLKPYFELKIVYHFSREDFHPSPSVDVVLLHFHKKQEPDIPIGWRREFRNFIERSHKYGITSMLTKRQISTALKLSGLESLEESKLMLYVQWLCLFRRYCDKT